MCFVNLYSIKSLFYWQWRLYTSPKVTMLTVLTSSFCIDLCFLGLKKKLTVANEWNIINWPGLSAIYDYSPSNWYFLKCNKIELNAHRIHNRNLKKICWRLEYMYYDWLRGKWASRVLHWGHHKHEATRSWWPSPVFTFKKNYELFMFYNVYFLYVFKSYFLMYENVFIYFLL